MVAIPARTTYPSGRRKRELGACTSSLTRSLAGQLTLHRTLTNSFHLYRPQTSLTTVCSSRPGPLEPVLRRQSVARSVRTVTAAISYPLPGVTGWSDGPGPAHATPGLAGGCTKIWMRCIRPWVSCGRRAGRLRRAPELGGIELDGRALIA